MTIRDIAIAIGFKIDEATEKKAEKTVDDLKSAASHLKENIVGFEVDKKKKETAKKSIEDIENAAEPLKNSPVGFEVDQQSERAAVNRMRRLRMTARRLLGSLGIGFGIVALVRKLRNFAKENEEVQNAAGKMREKWQGFKEDLDDMFGLTQRLTSLMVRGINLGITALRRLNAGLRRVHDMALRVGDRMGGIDNLLRLIGLSAGAIFFAFNSQRILGFLRMFSNGLRAIKLKTLGIVAIIVLIVLLIEDFIQFMKGNDSLMGELLQKFGIEGDMVRETIRSMMMSAKELIPVILDLAKQFGSIFVDALKELLPLLGELAMAILPIIFEVIKALLPFIIEIVQAILPVALQLIQALLPLVQLIVGVIGGLAQTILPVLVRLLESIMPILQPILGILQPIANVLGTIVGALGRVVELVGSGIGRVGDFIGGIFGGRGGGGGGTPGFAKGTNNTPDTFVAGEQGPELITKGRGRKVFTAAQTGDIFRTLKDISSLATTPRPETVAGATTYVENKTVIQNNEFTNQFYGDRAGQQKVADAADKAADDATGILSRGLAYVR